MKQFLIFLICLKYIDLVFLQSYPNPDLSYVTYDLKGDCPTINAALVNVSRLTGFWYRTHSNYFYEKCYQGDYCHTIYFPNYDYVIGPMQTTHCCGSAKDPTKAVCGAAVGSGSIMPTEPGQLNYTFGENQYIISVLDTDYDNFFVVYGCKPKSCDGGRDEILFIYARAQTLTPEQYNRAVQVIEMNGIDLKQLNAVFQGPCCPYMRLPKNS